MSTTDNIKTLMKDEMTKKFINKKIAESRYTIAFSGGEFVVAPEVIARVERAQQRLSEVEYKTEADYQAEESDQQARREEQLESCRQSLSEKHDLMKALDEWEAPNAETAAIKENTLVTLHIERDRLEETVSTLTKAQEEEKSPDFVKKTTFLIKQDLVESLESITNDLAVAERLVQQANSELRVLEEALKT